MSGENWKSVRDQLDLSQMKENHFHYRPLLLIVSWQIQYPLSSKTGLSINPIRNMLGDAIYNEKV